MPSSLLHCPGGADHKPAMSRCWGEACVMRSAAAAVWGQRSLPALEDVGAHAPVLPLLGLPVAALVDEAGLSGQRVPPLVEPQRLVAFILPACRGRQPPSTPVVLCVSAWQTSNGGTCPRWPRCFFLMKLWRLQTILAPPAATVTFKITAVMFKNVSKSLKNSNIRFTFDAFGTLYLPFKIKTWRKMCKFFKITLQKIKKYRYTAC